MGTYSGVNAVHETLVAGTADTVTLTGPADTVEIVNRTGNGEVFFTIGSPAAPPAAATVGGDCRMLPAAIGSYVYQLPGGGSGDVEVSIISGAAVSYTVQTGPDSRVIAGQ